MRPPTEAALTPDEECRNLTGALPCSVDVNEELSAHLGCLIVIAKHFDAMHDMSVRSYQVGAVFLHVPTSIRREHEGSQSPVDAAGDPTVDHDPGTTYFKTGHCYFQTSHRAPEQASTRHVSATSDSRAC